MEVSQSDSGLEVAIWQLGLGDGSESYPERPDEADCMYYLRTGFCGYGARCRFNHRRDRDLVVGAMRANGGYPERLGQPVCQYYMRTGLCKFGASCKYHHPRKVVESSSMVTLNISGYPLRPGENECSYYIKTGQCKFGVTCKFHHPQPAGVLPSSAALTAGPMFSVPSVIYPSVQSSYGPVLIPPGMVQFSGWNPYQGPVDPLASPNTQPTIGSAPAYAITQLLSPTAHSYTWSYLSMPSSTSPLSSDQKEQETLERPGKPECQYYMTTGDCIYGSSCRHHHPPEWAGPKTNFVRSPFGLPHHPGAPICSHYAENEGCKFGPSCKFDHPLTYSPCATSLVDIPVPTRTRHSSN